MKILIVSFYDDNLGDVLIRVCFENLFRTVLKNLGISKTNYEINKMSLHDIDEDLIKCSDCVFFAGGGLFGLSYLNFFEYLDKIVELAEQNDIPVIFSSMGINNMDVNAETEQKLVNLFKRKNIKSVSVRENIEVFRNYAAGCNFDIVEVCDPAVWCKYIYSKDIENSNKQTVGINVVRGGLFSDNGKKWGLTKEMNYLNELRILLEENGYDYKFYTNGSVLDNNALRYFKRKYDIPEENVVLVQSTRELVKTVSRFNFVAAIRMHSSIISYSLGIPAINIVWNDKIPWVLQRKFLTIQTILSYLKHLKNGT